MLTHQATTCPVSLKKLVYHPLRPLQSRITGLCGLILATCATTGLICTATHASERRFTYVYESTTQPKGTVEYEQWVTWKTDKDSDPKYDRFDFRHEIEFGITDNFQVAIYVADWRYQDGRSVANNGAEVRNSAIELIYSLSDPIEDNLGLALYGELQFGDEKLEIEGKLIVQKNIGKWVLAWNGIAEAEWEGERYDEDKGKLAQVFGASYQFSPKFTAGFELVHEIEYEDFSEWGDHAVFLGPNASFRTPNWWVTVTPLFQITDLAGEPNFQARFIFGFDF